jgi:SAM-dependent methyltransferase
MSGGAACSWEDAVRSLLEQPALRQVVLDCYYDRPAIAAARRYAASEEWRAVRERLPAGAKTAVDLGAGHGITAFALAESGLRVTAVEPDSSDLVGRGAIGSLAAESGLPIVALDGTAEHIPASDGSFDLALARQVLHHAHDLRAACREIFRVLRPGGSFVALRDHVVSSSADLPRFLDSHPLHRLYGGENAFRLEEYTGALRDAGFEIVELLRSFDSVINYAPHSRESLRQAFVERLAGVPVAGAVAGRLLHSEAIFESCLAAASRFDRRPGRLVSIICRRPAERPDG